MSKADLGFTTQDTGYFCQMKRLFSHLIHFELMRRPQVICLFLVIAILLVACVPDQPVDQDTLTGTVPSSDSPAGDQGISPWWRDAVFYEIFVRSFYDSDGDGSEVCSACNHRGVLGGHSSKSEIADNRDRAGT